MKILNDNLVVFPATLDEWQAFKAVMLGLDAAEGNTLYDYPVRPGGYVDQKVEVISSTEDEVPCTIWAQFDGSNLVISERVLTLWILNPEGIEPWEEWDVSPEIKHKYFTQEDWDGFLKLRSRMEAEYIPKEGEEEAEIWDIYPMGELISGLLEWGYGSGEEFYDYLTLKGLTDTEAKQVMVLLNRVE